MTSSKTLQRLKMPPAQSEKRFGQCFSFKKRRHSNKPFKRKVKEKKSDIIEREINELQKKTESIDTEKIETFADFPLSKRTLDGLKKAKYVKPTDIQRETIGLGLQGKDVLGAAKTGSGKTLAFLIPVMEVLFKAKTSSAFGMSALIITPTRELAYQIFEELNKIRTFHDFTVNLVIGGKRKWREDRLMGRTNLVVCTVGRLLDHLQSTQNFDVTDLKILVLDEADNIMNSNFAKDMDSIISYLPKERQTLMFSATQTRSVKSLARLSLKNPSYVGVHQHAQHTTPSGLQQSYVVVELHDKMTMLYSFLKTHPNNKIIVFLQTTKQVRYVHHAMKGLQLGVTMMGLHGKIDQLRRLDIYRDFCQKRSVILFTTDLAARGLDFPAVTWVIQMDCPPSVDTYIHRVGRTARFEHKGQALLFLIPPEEEIMVRALQHRKIPIKKIRVNKKKVWDITSRLSNACASCTETKAMAERAFSTFLYSMHHMKNRCLDELDVEKYAHSLGLYVVPDLPFLKKKKSNAEGELKFGADIPSGEPLFTMKEYKPPQTEDRQEEEESSDDEEEETGGAKKKKARTKAALAKKLSKKNITVNTRVVFDEEGAPVKNVYRKRQLEDEDDEDEGGIDVQKASKRLRLEDQLDKQTDRERIKQKHREERIKRKEKKRAAQQQRRRATEEDDEEEGGAVLAGWEEDGSVQYNSDPDELAARNEDSDDEGEGEGDDDGSDNSDDDSDDDGDNGSDDDSPDEGSDDEESGDEESDEEEEGDFQDRRRSLEDAALNMLKTTRLKK